MKHNNILPRAKQHVKPFSFFKYLSMIRIKNIQINQSTEEVSFIVF